MQVPNADWGKSVNQLTDDKMLRGLSLLGVPGGTVKKTMDGSKARAAGGFQCRLSGEANTISI